MSTQSATNNRELPRQHREGAWPATGRRRATDAVAARPGADAASGTDRRTPATGRGDAVIRLLIILAIGCGTAGCRLAQNAWWTMVAEPLHYGRNLDEKVSRRRFRGMAESALEQARVTARAERDDYESEPFSPDFERGFVDGFVDYLDAGGTGNPPPVPPRDYWKSKYQNPNGYECMQAWFEGYGFGANTARASNYRTFVTVPVSDAIAAQTEIPFYGRISPSSPSEGPGEPPRPSQGGDRYAARRRSQRSADGSSAPARLEPVTVSKRMPP